jgi:hypothetical protein
MHAFVLGCRRLSTRLTVEKDRALTDLAQARDLQLSAALAAKDKIMCEHEQTISRLQSERAQLQVALTADKERAALERAHDVSRVQAEMAEAMKTASADRALLQVLYWVTFRILISRDALVRC